MTYPEELEIFTICVWNASDVFEPVKNRLSDIILVAVVDTPSIRTCSLLVQMLKNNECCEPAPVEEKTHYRVSEIPTLSYVPSYFFFPTS